MQFERGTCRTGSVIERAEAMGLDPRMLYETVIELASEGLLTARCVNAAAGVLLTQLGLPEYFFQNISKDALKRVLRTVANNIQVREDDEVVLRGEVSEAQFDIDGGVQARIATPQNRDRMETVLDAVMNGNRVEYYFSPEDSYYTYIIHAVRPPVQCAGDSPEFRFAFCHDPARTCAAFDVASAFRVRHIEMTRPDFNKSISNVVSPTNSPTFSASERH